MPISHADYLMMLQRISKRPAQPCCGQPVEDESELHQAILDECKRRGWIALHGSMAHRTMRTIGEMDFVCLCDCGRVLLIEAKSKTGKLRPEQAALHAWAAKLGHTVHVVRNMAEFLEACKSV